MGRLSLTEQNLARICAQNRAFLLPAQPQLTKDNSVLRAFGSQDWPVKHSKPPGTRFWLLFSFRSESSVAEDNPSDSNCDGCETEE
jgi:hypothetical protein